jgi:membrane protease YdiL (CAAX protease family)
MKGMLRHKSGWSQFLLFIVIVLVSLFAIGTVLTLIVYSAYAPKMGMKGITDLTNIDFNNPYAVPLIRWLQVVQFISFFVIPVFFCARLFSSNTKRYLGLHRPWHDGYWIAGILVMVLAIPFSNLLGELNRNIQLPKEVADWMRAGEDEATKTMKALLGKESLKDLILNILLIAGLAAVGEELLFRGMAQRLLTKMFKSHWAGILVAAILFSAIHMQFYGFLPRMVLGILLGAIYWYSGSLYASMLAHFVYDALVIVIARYYPQTMDENAPVNMKVVALVAAVGLTLVIILLVWMKRRSGTTFREVYAEDMKPDNPFDGYGT